VCLVRRPLWLRWLPASLAVAGIAVALLGLRLAAVAFAAFGLAALRRRDIG